MTIKRCVDMNESDIEKLERQGCFSDDWSLVEIAEGADLGRIRNVCFKGRVSIGKGTEIINVPGGISNVRIGDHVRIVNVARIENSPNATFGIGSDISVLDETGNRSVRIYPGISAQIATIAARMPEHASEKLFPMIDRHIAKINEQTGAMPEIGTGAEIYDCGPIIDVRIWPYVKVEGVAWLKNGSIVNNLDGRNGLTYVGQGVNAENFIIEDAEVANGVLLRNTYVGQGCVIDKGFTSHDSLFFANCSMENGEACAVLAGPFTVSMHKSSLLIGCQTSFMNAGSGTNMSNHMYKLGPVHWGILERGTKTSSNSYLMHGSHIGVYSLIMGEHKKHPDSSALPFSYLFGDKNGDTIAVPGAMLKSYGLKRDEEKWPKRDRRLIKGLKQIDRITYHILNPYTAGHILKAIATTDEMLLMPADAEGNIEFQGLKIKRNSLEKGRKLYELALCKYIHSLSYKEEEKKSGKATGNNAENWVDLAGQIIPGSYFNEVLKAGSISEIEGILDKAEEDFDINEQRWVSTRLKEGIDSDADITMKASEFDAIVENDRKNSLNQISKESEMLSF
ncbi:MAG: DUF4954 family protein [Muribaculaceae bacterium]|nr:DUF4954 family protein [Muribaculaceae bacterium]